LIEHNSIIVDSVQAEVFSYRIPYKNLLFTKAAGEYRSSFVLTLEFFQDDKFIKREIVNPTITTEEYDTTLSASVTYQNWLTINLDPGTYTLKPILSLGSTEIEYKIPPQNIEVDSLLSEGVIGPIIISESNYNTFRLANSGNSIPFSPQKYSLVFGFNSAEADTLDVSITQAGNKVISDKFTSNLSGDITLNKVKDNINMIIDGNSNFKFYSINGFSHLLYEGKAELTLKYEGKEEKYDLNINWLEKPNILNNPEYSVKLLIYIENEETVADLLSADEADYYRNLTEYWVKNYPADGMKFNYAMEEYYSRADHAIDNYSSLNSFDGAERDRGKIYILYGEPTSIKRNYTEMNEIIEVWEYKILSRTFIFKDVNGTGKFDLTE
jgi:GWxTD domain-containing protein